MTEVPNVDNLIKRLRTQGGRAMATLRAIELGINVNSEVITRAIGYFASVGNHDSALRLCGDPNQVEKAVAEYDTIAVAEEGLRKRLRSGGVVYSKEGTAITADYLKDKVIERAEALLQQADDGEKAGGNQVARDNRLIAIRFLAFADKYDEAYKISEKYSLTNEAKRIFLKEIRRREVLGSFDVCSRLEELRANRRWAEMYRTIDTILKPK
ncbi:hypothetical protein HYV80_03965 [Candidatus Woesearchaeota archaeon]|nr:hypothetical protein [Candidatus Woesearchaeota archaeon]